MRIDVTDEMRAVLERDGTCSVSVTAGACPKTGEWMPVIVVFCLVCGESPERGAAAGCRTCVARSVLSG